MAARYPETTTHAKDCEHCKHDETELINKDGPTLEKDLAKFRVWNTETRKLEDCPKNGKHEKFISPDNFRLNDLPKDFRNQEFLDTIIALEKITVKIKVKSLSAQRSDGDDTSTRTTQSRVRYSGHNGSGWISSCSEFHKTNCKCCSSCFDVVKPPAGGKTCPCLECRNSQSPKQEWGVLKVRTAKHVVFDSTEAFGAEVTLFFNSDQTRDEVRTLSGFRVEDSRDDDADSCTMLVITHDERFHKELYGICYNAYIKKCMAFNRFSNIKSNVTIIISHPHGCYKQITVGKHVENNPFERIYVYTAPTCPGSSGAPCYLFGSVVPSPKNPTWYFWPQPHRKAHSCRDKTNSSGNRRYELGFLKTMTSLYQEIMKSWTRGLYWRYSSPETFEI